MIKNILTILLLFVFTYDISAQDENTNKLMLSGNVSDYFSEKSMTGVSVKLTSNGKYVNNVITDNKGEYEFFLDFEKEFTVLYEKAGFVSKKILVTTKGVPPNQRNKIADLIVEMTIFKKDKDLNVSFLDKPIGKAQYSAQTNEIDWNMGYTGPISQKLNGILISFKDQKKKKEEEEKQKNKLYAAAMKEADKAFFKKDFEAAKIAYQKALRIDSSQNDPKIRLELMLVAVKKKAAADRL